MIDYLAPLLPADDDALIPDRDVARLLGNRNRVTIWRETLRNPDFPPVLKINGRNFRRAGAVRQYLKGLANPEAARDA